VDGTTLLFQLEKLLEEDSDSTFIDDRLSYQFLNEAATDLNWRTKALRVTQSITTVADQAAYDIEPDYMGLYLMNASKRFVLKYYNASTNTYVTWKPYEEVILADQADDTASIPSNFTVLDNATLGDVITGSTTSDGDASGGECTLTDSGGGLLSAEAGDIVHNTTDSSSGVITSVTSATAAKCALFGGTDNEWDSSDDYVIVPQGRYQLVVNPPSATASHTITLYYLQRPAPVYTDYARFRYPSHFMPAIVKYAAWLYKYKDSEPNYGDKWYMFYKSEASKLANEADHVHRRKRFKVSFMA